MIVATAGHVDHGKTTLVRALTGTDTDRLPEEKRRGMSIELGFAFMPREGGGTIAFVDVPGHERFVRNMAAGVQGLDLALLVVAADDGPMPQTFEHLEILDLLGVPALLGVVTKVDRVAPERAEAVREEVRQLLDRTRFRGAEVVTTENGVLQLKDWLCSLKKAKDEKPAYPTLFRLNVDREFVIDGLGLVVTGTVLGGEVAVGDAVTVLPRNLPARVRSLRVNSGAAAKAGAGERCALALQGLERGDVVRGDTVAGGAGGAASRFIDVLLEKAPEKGRQFSVHLGTAFLPAQLTRLGGDGLARLAFAAPVCAWHGDRFLLRDSGSGRLAGGGTVLDPLPPQRGAAKPARLAFLSAIAGKTAAQALDALLALGPVDLDWLARCWHLAPEAARALAAQRPVRTLGAQVLSEERWEALRRAVEGSLAEWHAAHPDWAGMTLAQLRAAHGPVAGRAVDALRREGRIAAEGPYLRLPAHQPVLAAPDQALWKRTAPLLEGEGGRPPRVHELAEALAMEPKSVADFLGRAARAGLCHRVAANRYFLPQAIERLARLAASLDAQAGGPGFSAAEYRDASGLGRNLTIQVLEYLDRAGHTRRDGLLRHANIEPNTEEQRTPVGRPDFKSGERRHAPLASSTPASSASFPALPE